ncbi:hypothetical protein E0K99_03340 [Faecalicoccus pleomorphus]|uniref:ABC-three component system middle component 2 n=1 Tax=Faecalicoccus pleomorphus TaxID=1323 RepID=UPI0014317733|nr:ABC-three component system middle component 2 [Faecalicoccus pleomorphus]NJE40357.1 hypothetical protein [Faecalicoccus pleomorphus]
MINSQKKILFNSPFEMAVRILLLLGISGNYLSADKILSLDFIICYSKDYGFEFANLHGVNMYKLSEIANRRKLVHNSIKSLVTKGMIQAKVDKGYTFCITPSGKKFVDSLTSEYSSEYRKIGMAIIEKYGSEDEESLLKILHSGKVSEV